MLDLRKQATCPLTQQLLLDETTHPCNQRVPGDNETKAVLLQRFHIAFIFLCNVAAGSGVFASTPEGTLNVSLCDSLRRGAEKEDVESLCFHLFDVESPCTLFVSWTSAVEGSLSLKEEKKELKKLFKRTEKRLTATDKAISIFRSGLGGRVTLGVANTAQNKKYMYFLL